MLGSMIYFIPPEVDYLIYTLVFIASLSASVISNRGPAYTLVFIVTVIHFIIHIHNRLPTYEWTIQIGLTIAAFMGIETIQQLKKHCDTTDQSP